ncbi:MAG: serine hydrolase [Polyangiales bacterium]
MSTSASTTGQTRCTIDSPVAREFTKWADNECARSESGAVGMQLVLYRHGVCLGSIEVGTDGLGRALSVDDYSLLRCSICKPLCAIAIAELVLQGKVSYDTTLNEIFGRKVASFSGELQLEQLLLHTSGLHTLKGFDMNIIPVEKRKWLALHSRPAKGWRIGIDHRYSDSMNGILVGLILEEITGDSYTSIFHRILSELGVDKGQFFFEMDRDEYSLIQHRLQVGSIHDLEQMFPSLLDRTYEMTSEWNPSWGGTGSIRGLAQFYDRILAVQKSTGEAHNLRAAVDLALQHVPRAPGAKGYAYGQEQSRGFTIDLAGFLGLQHEHAPLMVGHFGYGTSVGLSDSKSQLAVAAKFSGNGGKFGERVRQWMNVLRFVDNVANENSIKKSTPFDLSNSLGV